MGFFLRFFDPDSLSIYVLVGAGSVLILSIIVFLAILPLKSRINPMRRAARYCNRARHERALVMLALELERNPENRQALLMRADAENALGRFSDAAHDYHRLIHLKKPGDGVDVLEVKKRLLKPLFQEQSLLELHTLCMGILKIEKDSPQAMYYLGLLYLGQMHYDRAAKTLDTLVKNRPNMADAHFALGLAHAQRAAFEDAARALSRALDLQECILYRVCDAAVHYFGANYRRCVDILRTIPQRQESFENLKQYLFYLKLRAFCNYRIGRFERAVQLLQILFNLRKGEGSPGTMLYARDGRVKTVLQDHGKPSDFTDYFRLKEVAAEEGRRAQSGYTRRIHDLEGLSPVTEAAVDLGFAMVRAGFLPEAVQHLTQVRNEHPEVLGLGRILKLIDMEVEMERGLAQEDPGTFQAKTTERILKGGGRGFKLWEYLEEWERNAIRPYQLLIISNFTALKMLSHRVLSGRETTGV